MKYAIRRYKINSHKKDRTLLPILLAVTVAVLLLIQVVVSNRLATAGVKINKIEEEIQDLALENTNLTEQIASASSLLTLREKATKLGYTRTIKPVYLAQDLLVARVFE